MDNPLKEKFMEGLEEAPLLTNGIPDVESGRMLWIFRRAQLPPEGTWVLGVVEQQFRDKIIILKYDPYSPQWSWQDEQGKKYRTRTVIYWMPLPALPSVDY